MAFGSAPDGFIDKPMRKVWFIDGTPTTPLKFELTLIEGDVSASNLVRHLHEMQDEQGGGKHQGISHGNRIYPEVSLIGKLDKFVGTTVKGTLFDFWNATPGTPYSGALNALPTGAVAGREPYRHILVEYEKSDSVTSYIGFESCVRTSGQYSDETRGQLEGSYECKGRVIADGQVICAPIGASITPPDWVPA